MEKIIEITVRTGDVVTDGKFIYRVIADKTIMYEPGNVWDGYVPEGKVVCCRLNKKLEPDRRFMSVKSTRQIIGQFKVFLIYKSQLIMLTRIIGEKEKSGY
jgi:hypothetical protein